MSSITRLRANPFAALMRVFATGEDVENNYYKFDDEQKASQLKADEIMEEASKPINTNSGKTNKKGGIRKKYVTPEIKPIKEMTSEKLEKMIETLSNDKEIGDK